MVDHYDFSNLQLFIDDPDVYIWRPFVTPFGEGKPFSAYSEEPLSVSFNATEPLLDSFVTWCTMLCPVSLPYYLRQGLVQ